MKTTLIVLLHQQTFKLHSQRMDANLCIFLTTLKKFKNIKPNDSSLKNFNLFRREKLLYKDMTW